MCVHSIYKFKGLSSPDRTYTEPLTFGRGILGPHFLWLLKDFIELYLCGNRTHLRGIRERIADDRWPAQELVHWS
jgi:hypothetical protein